MRIKIFTQRVVSLWNSLPQKAVEVKTFYVFNKDGTVVSPAATQRHGPRFNSGLE